MAWFKQVMIWKRGYVVAGLAAVNLAPPLLFLLWPHSVVAVATAVASVLVKLLGMPHQAIEIHRNRSAGSVSLVNNEVNYLSYGLWVAYGLQFHNLVILVSQLPGAAGQLVITALVLYYRGFRWLPRRNEWGHIEQDKECDVCAWVGSWPSLWLVDPKPIECPLCEDLKGLAHIVSLENIIGILVKLRAGMVYEAREVRFGLDGELHIFVDLRCDRVPGHHFQRWMRAEITSNIPQTA